MLPALVLLMAFALSPAAYARESPTRAALAIFPSLIEVALTPGAAQVVTVHLVNDGDLTYLIKPSMGRYDLGRYDASGRWSAEEWARASSGTLTLGPGEEREVAVEIRVPPDAAAGGRYAALTLETSSGANPTGSGRYHVPILITVPAGGDGDTLAAVLQVRKVSPILDRTGGMVFQVAVRNSGPVHCWPSGQVEIAEEGSKRRPVRLALESVDPLLPGAEAGLLSAPLSGLADGRHTALAEVACDGATVSARTSFVARPSVQVLADDALSGGAALELAFRNSGDVAVSPFGTLFAEDPIRGGIKRTDFALDGLLRPGEQRALLLTVPEGARSPMAGLAATVDVGLSRPDVIAIREGFPLQGPLPPGPLPETGLQPAPSVTGPGETAARETALEQQVRVLGGIALLLFGGAIILLGTYLRRDDRHPRKSEQPDLAEAPNP